MSAVFEKEVAEYESLKKRIAEVEKRKMTLEAELEAAKKTREGLLTEMRGYGIGSFEELGTEITRLISELSAFNAEAKERLNSVPNV